MFSSEQIHLMIVLRFGFAEGVFDCLAVWWQMSIVRSYVKHQKKSVWNGTELEKINLMKKCKFILRIVNFSYDVHNWIFTSELAYTSSNINNNS